MFERILFLLLFVSSSWDIFAKLELNGYSIRLFNIVQVLLVLLFLLNPLRRNQRYNLFFGYKLFLIWLFFLTLGLLNSNLFLRNIGYYFWLLSYFVLIIVFCTTLSSPVKFIRYFKLYLLSYIVMALFGIIQFLSGILGYSLKIKQWWIVGILPRINGLSYEPSYFGTYLVGGAILLYWLSFVKGVLMIRYQRLFTYLLIFAVFLTTSRIAILTFVFFYVNFWMYKFFVSFLRGKLNIVSGKRLMFVLLSVVLVMYLFVKVPVLEIFLSGVGLEGAPSHSVSLRLLRMKETIIVFLHNPIIGVGLGGIPSHIALLYGKKITSQLQAKHFEGMNVFLEVLAASGLPGFVFFLLFWLNVFRVHFLIRRKLNIYHPKISIFVSIADALGVMVASEFFALLMNQNILRPYLWISISFYLTLLNILRKQLRFQGCIRDDSC